MDAGLVGGILGGALGVLGGAVGTWFGIRNTSGPQERALMIRAAIVCWGVVITFVALLMLLPKPWSFLLWVPYGLALPLAIRTLNRRQQAIRQEESAQAPPGGAGNR